MHCAMRCAKRRILTTMTEPTNIVYTKKSPGCAKRDDSRSMALPYWYRKYGSSRMANFGFVIRNAVKTRHICGTIFVVKTMWFAKMYWYRLMMLP